MKDLTTYICAFNEAENIVPCIQAIQMAGCSAVVVIDAESTDRTSQLSIKEGAKVISTKKGLASQRQVAIEDCETEYLLFVDADDRIEESCIIQLFQNMETYQAAGVQAMLRVFKPNSYCQHAQDKVWLHCMGWPGRTKMVGRPALYKAVYLKETKMDTDFDGIGNEDVALSIRLEEKEVTQAVGEGISFRIHPSTWRENFRAWIKYGRGDALIVYNYPQKSLNIALHQLYNYPVKRSIKLLQNNSWQYIPYTVMQGLIRFITMLVVIPFVALRAEKRSAEDK